MNNYIVYIHVSPSGKRYVGITKRSVKERWGKHGQNYKGQPAIWNAICKYGWENFEHKVIYKGLTKAEATAKEIELIKKFNTCNPQFGYNITHGGEGTLGHGRSVDVYDLNGVLVYQFDTMTECANFFNYHGRLDGFCTGKKKIFQKQYVIRYKNEPFDKYPIKHTPNQTKVYQYTVQGECVGVYNSIKEAQYQTHSSHIGQVCRGESCLSNGYIWRYEGDAWDKYPITRDKKKVPIVQFDWYGNIIKQYDDVDEICTIFGCNRERIFAVCRHAKPSAYGFVWRYDIDDFYDDKFSYEKHYEIQQFSLQGELLHIYKDISDVKQKYNIQRVTNCCRGEVHSASGYVWRYIDDDFDTYEPPTSYRNRWWSYRNEN